VWWSRKILLAKLRKILLGEGPERYAADGSAESIFVAGYQGGGEDLYGVSDSAMTPSTLLFCVFMARH